MKHKLPKLTILFLFTITFLFGAKAQQSLLQKNIILNVKNISVKEVLELIEKQSGVMFSYSNSNIDVNKKVTVSVNNLSLKLTLDKVFNHTVSYYEKGNYIVLKQNEIVPEFYIDGFVLNGENGNGLYQTSIYEQQTLISAVSGLNGYFKLHIKKKLSQLKIKFSKLDFHDTLINIQQPQKNIKLNLKLRSLNPAPVAEKPNLILAPKLDSMVKIDTISITKLGIDSSLSMLVPNAEIVQSDSQQQRRNVNIFANIKNSLDEAWWFMHNEIDTIKTNINAKVEKRRKRDLEKGVSSAHIEMYDQAHKLDSWIDMNFNLSKKYDDSSKYKLKKELGTIGKNLDSVLLGVTNKIKLTAQDSAYYSNEIKSASKQFRAKLDSISEKMGLENGESKRKLEDKSDTTWRKIEDKFSSSWQKIHNRNITDTFSRAFQLGFVPPLSTNGFMSGRITNNVSLNMIAGYANGLNGFEAAGIMNVTRRDVRGSQFAGIGNLTGRNVNGLQAAGILNQNFGNTRGVQFAGIYNAVHKNMVGAQFSGIASHAGSLEGWQVSGIANMAAKTSNGVQLAGIVNMAMGKSKVTQIGGIANYAHIAKGAQIAGIVNVADTVYGVQIGLINISKKHYGVPIGLINISKYGYHQLAFDLNDRSFFEGSLRTGVQKFYTIWHAGIRMKNIYNTAILNYGFGVGSAWKISKKNFINTDVDVSYVNPLNRYNMAFNLWCRAKLNWNFYYSKNLSIATGPTWNGFIANTTHSGYGAVSEVIPARAKQVYNLSYFNHPFYSWFGWNVSIRFF